MAEEGTLGLARAQDIVHDSGSDDYSKEELQRRMDEARDSISQTVTEIKDSMVQQYESVKETISETLDWREQFKKQPLAWSLGAAGAGFVAGYAVAAVIKGPSNGHDYYPERYDDARSARRAYAAQPVLGTSPRGTENSRSEATEEENGPGLLQRIQETAAYDRLRSEASVAGNRLVDEISQTAQQVLLPAAVGLVREWLTGLVQKTDSSDSQSEGKNTRGYRYPTVGEHSQ